MSSPSRKRPARPFREIKKRLSRSEEWLAVDTAVDAKLQHVRLNREIGTVGQKIIKALGEQNGLYFQFERLISRRELEREEVYFDHGYDHGFSDGVDYARRVLTDEGMSRKSQNLADRIRTELVDACVSREQELLVLLQSALLMVVSSRRGE